MENELGKFLEELRGKISLREAATRSGLSHTYIRDLELGVNRKTKAPIRPSADTLKQLAKAYSRFLVAFLYKCKKELMIRSILKNEGEHSDE